MEDKGIRFIIDGTDAGVASEEIKKILQAEFDYDVQRVTDKDMDRAEQRKSVDPLTVVGLILALPGAMLAITDLVSRIRSKKRLDRVLEKIEKNVVLKKEVSVKIQYPDGMVKEINTVDSVEILDQLAK